MPIISPTILPTQPLDTRAYDTGRAILDPILKVLLQGFSSGQFGRAPTTSTPQNPGQLTFPSGATTRTSPQEMAQIQAMGGVPTRQGGFGPTQQITQMGQPSLGGVQYTQPTRLGMLPNLERQKTQAEIEKLQGDIAFQKQLPEIYKGLYGQGAGQGQGFYQVGDILERGGKRWKIVGMDTDGMPLVEPD